MVNDCKSCEMQYLDQKMWNDMGFGERVRKENSCLPHQRELVAVHLTDTQRQRIKQWIFALCHPMYKGMNGIDVGMHLIGLAECRNVTDPEELQAYYGVSTRTVVETIYDTGIGKRHTDYLFETDVAWGLSRLLDPGHLHEVSMVDGDWPYVIPQVTPNRGNKNVRSGLSPFAKELTAA